MFSRLPTLKNFAKAAGGLAGLILICAGLYSGCSNRSAKADLQAALNSRPGAHQAFDPDKIDKAIQEFGSHRKTAFVVLEEASNETNTIINAGSVIDTNRFVRAGALYGMGQLGESVPEVTPFLWGVIYSPSRNSVDRCLAFQSLQKIGFEPRDIPTLAKLLSNPACNQTILTLLVPETISGLIESNPPAATQYLSSVENLLDDSNPDTQFRAALALVKSERADNPKIFSALHTLFQRPKNRDSEYYKFLAAQILGEAGPAARPLVPNLWEYAKSASEVGVQKSVYDAIAKIEPDLLHNHQIRPGQ
jgi:hypothetical protein